MPTMPVPSLHGQPGSIQVPAAAWFASAPGRAVLDSEAGLIAEALADTRGLCWLWLAPIRIDGMVPDARGLFLHPSGRAWAGTVRCALPLPLASESVGVAVLQHPPFQGQALAAVLQECARVLAPGGRLLLFALNPLAPYRWRWRAGGMHAVEPLTWRRRLRRSGLTPVPLSQGVGPSWRVEPAAAVQVGAGLRAAYLLHAQKRHWPATPIRLRRPRPILAV